MTPRAIKKAGRYIRVSRVGARAGDESYGSPDDQRRASDAWATYRKARGDAVEIDREYVDEDESGGSQDRPGLVAAIEDALAGKIDAIVCYDISRFSRFTEGGLRDLRRLQEAGARLVFVTEDIDTSTTHGKMIYTILLATHEAALEQAKARWRVTKARGIREGRQIGPTPTGYTRARGKHGQLVPHPTEGPAITRAFELAALEGLPATIKHLARAIPTKSFAARKQKTADKYGVELGDTVTVPATWNASTVRRTLAQRVYLGEAYYRYADGTEEVNRSAHEPLTTLEVFTLAQSLPDDRRAPAAVFPISGHLVCGSCGEPMAGSRSGSKASGTYRRVYKCTRPGCVRRTSVSAEPVEAMARDLLATYAAENAQTDGPVDLDAVQAAREALDVAQAKLDGGKLPDDPEEAAAIRFVREQVRDKAQAAYEGALSNVTELGWGPGDVAGAADDELGDAFKSLGRVVRVLPGRGNLDGRVSLV